jgi:hypothetical protein
MVAALAVSCGGGTHNGASSSSGPTSAVSHARSTTSTTWPREAVPGTAYAIGSGGITEVSTVDGRAIRKIADLPAGQEPGWIEADRAHGRIFFGTNSCDGPSWIWVVSIAGGSPSRITDGYSVSVSPDGTRIAFPRLLDGCAAAAIVVRDIQRGTETIWDGTSTISEVGSVAWAPDGHRLAYESLPDHHIYILDTRDPHAALGGKPILVGRLGDAAIANGKWTVALISPCPPEVGDGCPAHATIVDADTGAVLRGYPEVANLIAVDLNDAGTALLLQQHQTSEPLGTLAARFGERTVTKIVSGLILDW